MSFTERVPPEVLVQVIDRAVALHLSLRNPPTLAICRRWRAVTLDCPSFWKQTTFRTPCTEGAFQMNRMRLEAAEGRLCQVFVRQIPTSMAGSAWRSGRGIQPDVMALVAQHMHHIGRLHLDLYPNFIDATTAALAQSAAPVLTHLTITITSFRQEPDSTTAPSKGPVLTRLFAGSVPQLTYLDLHGIGTEDFGSELEGTVPPAWFAQITNLRIGQLHSVPWRSAFPNVRSLTLTTVPVDPGSKRGHDRNLVVDFLYLPNCAPPAVSLAKVGYIEVDLVETLAVENILAGFEDNDGSLTLALKHAHPTLKSLVLIHFTETAPTRTYYNTRTRSFREIVDDWRTTRPRHNLLKRSALLHRVTTLDTTFNFLTIFHKHLPSRFPNLQKVTILLVAFSTEDLLSEFDRSGATFQPINCPELQLVTLADSRNYREPRRLLRSRAQLLVTAMFEPMPNIEGSNIRLV